jgi:Leu/Phe-tRNA-protein transferase
VRFAPSGHAVLLPGDDADRAVDELLASGYPDEFCLFPRFEPEFVAGLAAAGFLVMSQPLPGPNGAPGPAIGLAKLHLVRSLLDPADLREGATPRRLARRYEFVADGDFPAALAGCAAVHGEDWLTAELRAAFLELWSGKANIWSRFRLRPMAFCLYRGGHLVAGEFGMLAGAVYTSYSGFRIEDSAGSVQLLLTGRWLRGRGAAFWDLGMPLAYKTSLGARELDRADFIARFRCGRAGDLA